MRSLAFLVLMGAAASTTYAITIREYDTEDCTGPYEDSWYLFDWCESWTWTQSGDVQSWHIDCPVLGGIFSSNNRAKVTYCHEDKWCKGENCDKNNAVQLKTSDCVTSGKSASFKVSCDDEFYGSTTEIFHVYRAGQVDSVTPITELAAPTTRAGAAAAASGPATDSDQGRTDKEAEEIVKEAREFVIPGRAPFAAEKLSP